MNRLIHQSILTAMLLVAVTMLAIAIPNSNIVSAHEEPPGLCDRNQVVQDSVLAKLPGIDQCSGVTGEHLRGLSGTLDLSSQGITALSAGDFQGMSGITGIDASGNQLSRVPGNLLQQLRHQSHTHSTTETSRNGYVIAVIDKSGSMSGQLSTAKSGARWLAANRPDSMPMAVMAFSNTAHTAQDFTTETDSLNNAINNLSANGSTNIDDALAGTYSQADSRPDTSLPVAIIVFSDGGFTLSGSLHDTMSTNSVNGVKVSTISTSGHNANMQNLAARGGGVYNTQPSSSQSGSYFPIRTTSETTTTTNSHEPSITSLDLSGNSLSSLPSGTFAQLPTLTSINLRDNSLTSVPAGVVAR
jgi:Mg-chelatase subunit ChlD